MLTETDEIKYSKIFFAFYYQTVISLHVKIKRINLWLYLGAFQETRPDPECVYNIHVVSTDRGDKAINKLSTVDRRHT